MDEPTSGTTSRDRGEMSEAIVLVAESGTTLVFIDHDVDFVTKHCNEVLVMSYGAPFGVGAPREILARPEVIAVFSGRPTDTTST